MDERIRKGPSLKPSDSASSEPTTPAFSLDPAVLQKCDWIPEDEAVDRVIIRSCHVSVMNSIDMLHYSHNVSKAIVARFTHLYGWRRLWAMPGVFDFVQIRRLALELGDAEDIRWFREGNFEGLLRDGDGTFQHDLYQASVRPCGDLAAELGIRPNQAHQLALMMGFFQSEGVPLRDRDAMYRVLSEFKDWIAFRVERGREREQAIKERRCEQTPDPSKLSLTKLLQD